MILSEIKLNNKQCRKLQALGVCVVYLFGSQAEGKDFSFSDVDLGIVLQSRDSHKYDYSSLYNSLYVIFTDVFPEQSLDIVFLDRGGLEIGMDAVMHGKILYESSSAARITYEQRVMMFYADFKPILNIFDKEIMQRI